MVYFFLSFTKWAISTACWGFFPSLVFIFCTWQLQHGYNSLKGPLKTFSFNDACNLSLFKKSNTKMSFFSEIKTYLISIALHLWFIYFAYLSSLPFLFPWISLTFPCYLLKYCISHELLPRLRHGSFCCCPLMGHGQMVDHTFILLTVCAILILYHNQLKTAAKPKFTPLTPVLDRGDVFRHL